MKKTFETYHSTEELDMVMRVRQGDQRAFNTIVDHYSNPLMGVLFRMLDNREDAEEALQNTFLKAWKYLDQFDQDRGRLFSWLCGIARNQALDISRLKRYKVKSKTEQPDEHVLTSEGDEGKWGARADAGMLRGKLDEQYRIVLDYLYLQGYTQSETAEELNIPLGTVKTRARKAISILRDVLKNEMVWIIFIMYWAINQLFGS